MANISKKLEQIEKLKKELLEEKEKIENTLGKELINQFGLDYESLTKNEIKEFVDNLKDSYDLMNEDQSLNSINSVESPTVG
ncbi:hypothetical protein CAT7_11510 [Carnobacterium sp. AT7]|uniref:hypothetical protein n=1 Tax=Carnobacterium sp. AT7 TaxID=333990 RepID=UPI00015F2E2D|nr:hypothetical protein [Carnobacterium sp. AT7]EDP68128.1 hypothetical protein CAT7_11125 [Carnobacterium sp. AT7]EDP68205.1 hypothetical protein CAT7_11510 [Carnobacterium sp. AT7]